jgi:ABC-type multidrug transport system fused ATPase/permease subunit
VKKRKNILKLLYFVYSQYYSKKKFRIHIWLYLFFKLLQEIYPLVFSFLSAKIIDEIINLLNTNSASLQDIIPSLIGFGILLFFGVIIHNGFSLTDSLTYLWNSYIEDDIYLNKYIEIEPQAYEDSKFVNQKNTISWNSWTIFNSMQMSIENLTLLITTVVAFFAIYQQNYLFAIIAVLSSIPAGIVTTKFGRQIWNIWSSNSEEKVKYSNYRWPLWETKFEGIQEIFVFRYGRYLLDRARSINKEFTAKLEKNNIKKQIWLTLTSLWENIFFLAIIVYSVKLAIDGQITVGALTFIIAAYQQFNDKVRSLVYNISYISGNRNLLESFYSMMNRESKIKSGDKILPENKNGVSIEFRNVSFKYPKSKKWILRKLNFIIDSDEDLAIVGRNGAGKTTLVKLLLRIYDPNEGEILINGINIKELDLDSYYGNVGVLTQRFNQLAITAKDNIHIGDIKKKDFKGVKEAAILADIDEAIEELPLKYDTYLTKDVKGGIQLSGGQWQKIAIARAFYRGPKLLILDEPTSAVDSIAEEKIFDNIRKNAQNQTTLIISHRFSTVKKAKRIIVIDNGDIVESGSHSELMKKKGLYSEMYLKQSGK